MNESTKLLHFGENIPVQMRVESTMPQTMHWHNHVELYYVLSGTATISLPEQEFSLCEDQLIIINPFTSHAILNTGATLAIFSINLSLFDQHVFSASTRFDCNSLTSGNSDALLHLKRTLAKFVKNNVGGCTGKELINKSLSYELLHILVSDFSAGSSGSTKTYSAQMARMENILTYTNEHYAERLSLSELAERYYLTVPYMSKFFKTMMGTTFTDYMNDIRLSHALNDLIRHDVTTEELAERHGFANARSLVSIFRQKYHMTPAQYKRQQMERMSTREYQTDTYDLSDVIHTNHLGILSQYLSSDQFTDLTPAVHRHITELPPINTTAAKTPFSHAFKKATALGRAKEILFSENQKILRRVQEQIRFSYLGFHGLLDDDMMIYSEDANGNPELSFSMVDAAFDFLKSIGLRPILELSFMPKALASRDYRIAYYTRSVISLPYDMEKWNYLIRGLINHLMDRYGDEEVVTWPIYLWNTPDLTLTHLGRDGMDDYNRFYYETYQTVKSCNKDLIFGSPNFTNHSMASGEYLTEFIQFAKANHCMPDFLCMNHFSMRNSKRTSERDQTETNLLLVSSPNGLQESLDDIELALKKLDIAGLPLHICEWNSTISHRELLNDTAFKSAYVVKNIVENHNRFSSLTYWSLTDLLEEVKLSGQQFHGGLGMFTFDGTPKSVYYAYELLAQLGDSIVAQGDGYIMTKSSGEWQILLYNYHHYSGLYASGELFDVTPVNRYTPFDEVHMQKYVIPLENLADGNYTLSETIINRDYGSSFDKWVEIGADTLVDPKEQQYLVSSSIPKMARKTITVEHGQTIISRELEPHEVRLIKIRRHYTL